MVVALCCCYSLRPPAFDEFACSAWEGAHAFDQHAGQWTPLESCVHPRHADALHGCMPSASSKLRFLSCATYHGSEFLSFMHASEHAFTISFTSNESEVRGCGNLHDGIVRNCVGILVIDHQSKYVLLPTKVRPLVNG